MNSLYKRTAKETDPIAQAFSAASAIRPAFALEWKDGKAGSSLPALRTGLESKNPGCARPAYRFIIGSNGFPKAIHGLHRQSAQSNRTPRKCKRRHCLVSVTRPCADRFEFITKLKSTFTPRFERRSENCIT
ncbi:hypothetical protein OKW30_005210 [Paraburkholderia sp. Clong3]|uniref:hypothetical protein n=1 Tax=Paraburkholderia sp. Clong3 TaxID=2991061 RepID=UPI003D21C761